MGQGPYKREAGIREGMKTETEVGVVHPQAKKWQLEEVKYMIPP